VGAIGPGADPCLRPGAGALRTAGVGGLRFFKAELHNASVAELIECGSFFMPIDTIVEYRYRVYIDFRVRGDGAEIRGAYMADDIRLSGPTLKVLKLMLEKPRDCRSGAEVSKLLGIGSGTLYPLLARLEGASWLKSEWETVDPSEVGRPRRRFYKLTGQGQTRANRALAELQTSSGVLAWN
jgi:PadR family transcriptional regulator PadR